MIILQVYWCKVGLIFYNIFSFLKDVLFSIPLRKYKRKLFEVVISSKAIHWESKLLIEKKSYS